MKLLTLHKILIGAALAFFIFFGIREVSVPTGSVALGIGALALGGGLAAYFIWVLRGGYEKK